MKVVYPVCCGVDVHKSFFIATIITTTSDIQPNYSRKRFSTFNNDIIRFADWLNQNNCNDPYEYESAPKRGLPAFRRTASCPQEIEAVPQRQLRIRRRIQ